MPAKRFRLAPVFVLAAACSSKPPAPTVPLYDSLGSHSHTVTAASPDVQQYFDQGLRLSYAFNHGEAIRAFKQAIALDPSCAMCYWGVAYAAGPNINAPITEEAATEAWQAIEQARTLAGDATERERAYIEALAKRYTADPTAARAPLDAAYAEAMRDVSRRFPDDLDAAVLFAQSLMDTAPWNYWNPDGTPRAFTNDVIAALESVLKRQPDHAGAIHLYIHAVEASPNPGRAEQYADALPRLMPGAGHIVHMPAHIYLRTGRYQDASVANQNAAKADEAYLAGDRADNNMTYEVGYYTHNIHFFAMSASMEGRRADALRAAEDLRAKMHPDMLRDPGMGGMVQHFHLTPLFMKIRFGMWDEILADPGPPDDLPYMRAIWYAARGMAHAARGRLEDAEVERTAVGELKDLPALKTLVVSSVNTTTSIVAIAYEILQGDIALKRKRAGEAADHYALAVALEDALTYMEPPDWPIPVRQLQGAALLELGRAGEAEAAFLEDMRKFPDNGWSLSGLEASLERQGRGREAADVKARIARAWGQADIALAAARPRAAAAVETASAR
jgi:tetratricopeptide (TPR) repeat protein